MKESAQPRASVCIMEVSNMNNRKALTRVISLAVALLAAVGMVATVLAAVTVTSETKIVASDAAADDLFGRVSNSLALSGETAVSGAYRADTPAGANSGAAYIFTKSGSAWPQEAKLVPSDAAANDLFGQAVAIDGDVVLIGSFFDDDDGSHSGSAYVFRRASSIWTEEAKLIGSDTAEADQFGFSVSLVGNVAVIGSPFDDDLGLDSGSVYVFRWNGSAWAQEAKLLPSDGIAGGLFGYSVSLNGDVIVVGSAYADYIGTDSGAAYVFRWNGSAWVQEQKLTGSDTDTDDKFGFSVSVEADTAIVGAFGVGTLGSQDTGASYVFKWNGSTWTEEAKLEASDGKRGNSFGVSVDISGNLVVVGASLGDGNKHDSGAAYVFQRSGTTWTQEAKLTAGDGAKNDRYGESVTIYGTTAMAGAPRDDDAGADTGAAYIYELSIT